MKYRHLICLLLTMFLMAGCTGEIPTARQILPVTEAPKTEINPEVRPGIYMSNRLTDFSFPTSGYDVYIVGETHGNQEAKQVFQTYLKALYENAGVRDVVLEEDQGYESDANAYVQGRQMHYRRDCVYGRISSARSGSSMSHFLRPKR